MRNLPWAELKWKWPHVSNEGYGEYLFDFWDQHPFLFPLWNLCVSQYIDIFFLRENIFLQRSATTVPLVAFLPLFHAALGSGDNGEHCPVFHPLWGSVWVRDCPGQWGSGRWWKLLQMRLKSDPRKGWMKQTGTNKVKVCLGLLMENSTKLTHWDPQLSGEQWCRAQRGCSEHALLNEWSWSPKGF